MLRTARYALLAIAVVGSASAASAEPRISADTLRVLSALRFEAFGGNTPKLVPVGQVYGQRCVTKSGWCPISPQPVGSSCMCGKTEGTTLQ